jgi:hypothetical protein
MACPVRIHEFGGADALRSEGVAIGESGAGGFNLEITP